MPLSFAEGKLFARQRRPKVGTSPSPNTNNNNLNLIPIFTLPLPHGADIDRSSLRTRSV